jgi:hypothetical protein
LILGVLDSPVVLALALQWSVHSLTGKVKIVNRKTTSFANVKSQKTILLGLHNHFTFTRLRAKKQNLKRKSYRQLKTRLRKKKNLTSMNGSLIQELLSKLQRKTRKRKFLSLKRL